MKITFLGGADEVGASSTMIDIAGKRILVDCGIRPSPKSRHGLAGDQLPNLEQIPSVDAVLVTHAHTDHTGALELILEHFPEAPVYATAPTIALTRVLHQDARRIMQSRLDEEGELPLFDDVAVERLMSAFVPAPFKTRLSLGDGLAVTFFPAGHIAGAAMLGLESDEGNLLISGDLSISPQRTVDGARPPAFQPDVFLVESTYGGRLHANRAVQERKLVETVAQVTAADGKVLIPAFALGRAQEILLILSEFQRRGELPAVPVWADGMVRAICQAYTSFAEVLPLPLQERGAKFFEGNLRPVQNTEQRNALVWQPGAAVIVASSGMLAGGPSLSYARALASNPQHAILLTGYQDEESPGRRLQELAEKGHGALRLAGDKIDVQCRLGTYSLSAHADESQLLSLVETLNPQHVVLVHGDQEARASLEKALRERRRIVHLPLSGQTLQFHFDRHKNLRQEVSEGDFRSRWETVTRERRARLRDFADSVGKWLLLQGDVPTPVRCLALESDHLWVEVSPGLEQAAFPEEILAVFSFIPPGEADLAPYLPRSAAPAMMEPNQALVFANGHFPPEARLRKVGYRLDQHTLVLTFDFPDVARRRFASEIIALQSAAGWQVEVAPEANQSALNALARGTLPAGWKIVKGPAIHREQKRVAVSVTCDPATWDQSSTLSQRFLEETGYEMDIAFTSQFAAPVTIPVTAPGEQLEINSAYHVIKTALAGSTLYRTSLKGDEIVLSFISPQVGERYQEVLADLSQRTGWLLSINPNPNQGAILEIARALFHEAGWKVAKGPSIYPEKAEVAVVLANPLEVEEISRISESFTAQTGFRLVVSFSQSTTSYQKMQASEKPVTIQVVEIPLTRIRLRLSQQSLVLDPLKLEKAIERIRHMGITPPITVRRAGDGYVLVDGLYRLRAAEALGMERIPALVE